MNKRICVFCDNKTVLKVVYSIKEKIGQNIKKTIWCNGGYNLDIIAEDGTRYFLVNLSTLSTSFKGLKADEIWYCFSDEKKEKYLDHIMFCNCHLSQDKIKEY